MAEKQVGFSVSNCRIFEEDPLVIKTFTPFDLREIVDGKGMTLTVNYRVPLEQVFPRRIMEKGQCGMESREPIDKGTPLSVHWITFRNSVRYFPATAVVEMDHHPSQGNKGEEKLFRFGFEGNRIILNGELGIPKFDTLSIVEKHRAKLGEIKKGYDVGSAIGSVVRMFVDLQNIQRTVA